MFPDIPIVRAYATADGVVGRILLRGSESWDPRALPADSTAPARAFRKPSTELIAVALKALNADSPEKVLMVGDQYLTDIAGANLAGIRSLKVPTYAPASFPVSVRILQASERLLYRATHPRP